MNLPKPNGSAILRAVLAFLILQLIVTPLTFYAVFPATKILVANWEQNGWKYELIGHIPQYLIYAVIVGLFYFMVVRPMSLRPVLISSNNWSGRVATACCMITAFVLMTPINVLFTPYVVGFLTFMITGISEEWVFRGVLTRVIKDRVGIIWGSVIISISFAAWHWAEIFFVGGKHPFTWGWFNSLGSDFIFGMIFTAIVWRSRSMLWGGFMHCFSDWQPWVYSESHWITAFHLPGGLIVYAVGLVGAEIIRIFSRGHFPSVKGKSHD